MFYEGDLQSGIAKAVQQNKSVVCFITDGGEGSSLWGRCFEGAESSLSQALELNAITLRLAADSEAASQFSAFCPFPSTPFMAVVFQGQIVERITSETPVEDLADRLVAALTPRSRADDEYTGNVASQAVPLSAEESAPPSGTQLPTPQAPAQVDSSSEPVREPVPSQSERDIQNLLSERRARQEAQQQAERQRLHERARIRKQEVEEAAAATAAKSDNKNPAQRSYLEEQAKRKKQAALDRDRVRKQIEYDKQERKERAERERAARQSTTADQPEEPPTTFSSPSANQSAKAATGSTRLQIRLLDASSLRTTFPSSTPFSEVRIWMDSNRTDGNTAYTIKQLMTPAPSRTIGEGEEQKSLAELGLHPSATLILSPVASASAAYATASSNGFAAVISWMIYAFWRIVSMGKTFLGLNPAPSPGSATNTRSSASGENRARTSGTSGPTAGTGSIRIRTLNDQRRQSANDKQRSDDDREHQLYNGGGLNFEPRPKDETHGTMSDETDT